MEGLDAGRLHRDAQATGVEALHRVPEPFALLAQEVVGREPHVLERERDGVRGSEAHLILRLPRTITGGVGGHNKRADPALRAGHHHHEIRRAAVRGPGFCAGLPWRTSIVVGMALWIESDTAMLASAAAISSSARR